MGKKAAVESGASAGEGEDVLGVEPPTAERKIVEQLRRKAAEHQLSSHPQQLSDPAGGSKAAMDEFRTWPKETVCMDVCV